MSLPMCGILHHFSHQRPESTRPTLYKLKSKSFLIVQGNPNIWAFVIQVTMEIEVNNRRSGPHPNLPSHLRQAIQVLKSNKHIVIKLLDKGGNLVIMNTEGSEEMPVAL